MTKLELLNVFLNERLTAAADEIFRAIKDTIVEYQGEILRSKEENERLNRLLNIAVQRLLLHPEPQSIQAQEDEQPAEPQLCEQDWASGFDAEEPEEEPEPPPPHIKEEPELRNIDKEERRPACEFDTDAACLGSPSYADGACGQVDHPQRSHLHHPAHTDGESVSPLLRAVPTMDIKVEHDYSNYRGAPHDSPADVNRIQRREKAPGCEAQQQQQQQQQQSKAPAHAVGKQSSAHILRLKNAKASRTAQTMPRPSHQAAQGLQKWHYCRECGKSFSFACQLEVHMRWHTKEKPYGCAVCRKSFTTVSMLKRHHRIHTGEKPFRCSVCGKCFNQSAHLNTHFRLHTAERDRWTRAPHPSPK